MHTKVETAVDFKKVVVDQNYNDYKADPTNLRLAFNLAVTLFHLRDWTFWEHSSEVNWQYKNVASYQKYLEQQCANFGYIRDLANAVKHAELNPNMKPSTHMVGLANTAISTAAFQSNAYQNNAYQTQTTIVSKTDPTQHVVFQSAADDVMNMWNTLFVQNGWK